MSEPQAAAVLEPAAAGLELLLIDLSSIAYPIWHMSGTEPDPDYVSRSIVARVRSLAAKYPRAAICCDSGKSFRHEISPDYKANRPKAEAPLVHQIKLAEERLAADGFPVWKVKGFEADDLIATATVQALTMPEASILIVSSDKDLLQLVGPRVRVMRASTGDVFDEAAVSAKFGVRPDQIRDYLALVGDSADNVKGAKGIGAVKAAELLSRYGSLVEVYRNLDQHGSQFKPAMATALREFAPRLPETQALITLATGVPIPFVELDNERIPKNLPAMEIEDMSETETIEAPAVEPVKDSAPAAAPVSPGGSTPPEVERLASRVAPSGGDSEQTKPAPKAAPMDQALAVREPAPVVEFEKQLEPRSLGQAAQLANQLFMARLFGEGYGNPQAVLSTIIAGRELGLPTMTSLRVFHIVEGKHQMHADFIRARVLQSGLAKYFRCTERTNERATFETQREGDPPFSLTYTMADAEMAGLVKDKSGWKKNPADMLVARASSKLARLVYPEAVHGLYAPEEFD
jgi:5'-3' exonuclease